MDANHQPEIPNRPGGVFILLPVLNEIANIAALMDRIEAQLAGIPFTIGILDDGSTAQACPPLKALLHIMLDDEWEGKGLEHPEVRKLFTLENLLSSDWYAGRLAAKQRIDRKLWRRHVEYLDKFLKRASHAEKTKIKPR